MAVIRRLHTAAATCRPLGCSGLRGTSFSGHLGFSF